MTVEGAPGLLDEHLAVFDCANKCGRYGKRYIAADGHIEMMAATQVLRIVVRRETGVEPAAVAARVMGRLRGPIAARFGLQFQLAVDCNQCSAFVPVVDEHLGETFKCPICRSNQSDSVRCWRQGGLRATQSDVFSASQDACCLGRGFLQQRSNGGSEDIDSGETAPGPERCISRLALPGSGTETEHELQKKNTGSI